jgi:hypothetical protein
LATVETLCLESSSVKCRVCRSFGQVKQLRLTAPAALHRVPGRHIQGHDRLRMVHVLSGQHVLRYSQRDLARHVHGVSGELHFRDWKRVEGLLPVPMVGPPIPKPKRKNRSPRQGADDHCLMSRRRRCAEEAAIATVLLHELHF